MFDMIVVTGATGTIGSELVSLLSEKGAGVRAISRNPPGESGLSGVEWRQADLADRGSLEEAFAGAERLFLLTGNVEHMVGLQKNAIAAAEGAGLESVVKLSALGASDHSNSVIGVWHYIVEQRLRGADIEWTILRPHVFMQNLLQQIPPIHETDTIYSPAGDAEIPMVDTRDIAAVAAAILTGEGHGGKRYTITGGEALSYRRAAEILSDVTGRAITYERETEDQAWARLHGAGQPVWLIGAQLALADYQRRGGGTALITDTVEHITSRPPRTFEEFARDHAAKFA